MGKREGLRARRNKPENLAALRATESVNTTRFGAVHERKARLPEARTDLTQAGLCRRLVFDARRHPSSGGQRSRPVDRDRDQVLDEDRAGGGRSRSRTAYSSTYDSSGAREQGLGLRAADEKSGVPREGVAKGFWISAEPDGYMLRSMVIATVDPSGRVPRGHQELQKGNLSSCERILGTCRMGTDGSTRARGTPRSGKPRSTSSFREQSRIASMVSRKAIPG